MASLWRELPCSWAHSQPHPECGVRFCPSQAFPAFPGENKTLFNGNQAPDDYVPRFLNMVPKRPGVMGSVLRCHLRTLTFWALAPK